MANTGILSTARPEDFTCGPLTGRAYDQSLFELDSFGARKQGVFADKPVSKRGFRVYTSASDFRFIEADKIDYSKVGFLLFLKDGLEVGVVPSAQFLFIDKV